MRTPFAHRDLSQLFAMAGFLLSALVILAITIP
jgi:hypothetical protein